MRRIYTFQDGTVKVVEYEKGGDLSELTDAKAQEKYFPEYDEAINHRGRKVKVYRNPLVEVRDSQ